MEKKNITSSLYRILSAQNTFNHPSHTMSCSEYEPKILGRQSLKCVCVGGGGTEGGGGEAVERGEGVEGGGTWSPTPAL